MTITKKMCSSKEINIEGGVQGLTQHGLFKVRVYNMTTVTFTLSRSDQSGLGDNRSQISHDYNRLSSGPDLPEVNQHAERQGCVVIRAAPCENVRCAAGDCGPDVPWPSPPAYRPVHHRAGGTSTPGHTDHDRPTAPKWSPVPLDHLLYVGQFLAFNNDPMCVGSGLVWEPDHTVTAVALTGKARQGGGYWILTP